MILYRPVGLQELELVYDSGMRTFPARLPQQPIFYPVLQLEYARQIASDWNIKNGQFAGYVTEFKVDDDYIGKFEIHTVGGTQHQELWIPAEEMERFNQNIVGHIKVVNAYFGDAFDGFVPEKFGLQGKNAVEQFTLLANSYLYKRMDFYLEIKRNHKAIFLNYPFWQRYEFKNPGLKEKIIQAIKEAWLTSFPKTPLPSSTPVQADRPPGRQTPTQIEDVADAIQENTPPVEQIDSSSFVHPVRTDVSSVKPTPPHRLVAPLQEDTTPVKEPDSYAHSLVKPWDEEIRSVEESDSDILEDPVQADTEPDEDIHSIEGDDLHPLLNPVDEDPTPVDKAASHVLGRSIRQHTPLPEQRVSHFLEGIALGVSGNYREAIEELSQAIEEDPDQVTAHTSLGVAFHRLGEDDRALACYETALQIDPNDAEAHYFRANILYNNGNVREAITGYTIALGLAPELIEANEKPAPQDRLTDYIPFPAGAYGIARLARQLLDLNKSLETNPGQAYLFKERAATYYRLWNYEQAIADYSSSLALQPEDARALHSRGLAYEQLGKSKRALEDYQRAIAINPQLSDVYLHRGVTLGKMRNFRQSITSLTEGIRLSPRNPIGYFNRGVSYFQQGDFASAIEDFSNVIRLSPNHEAAHHWRGIANEEAGRQREAIADYRRFLELSQDPNARKEIEQRLNQWNEGKRNSLSSRSSVREDRQKTDQVPAEEPAQNLDLYALIAALGERALNSTWFGSGVECYGEKAEQLYAFIDHNKPIQGRELLDIASGINRTIQGDFTGFDPETTNHWILIRAWEGSGFYIELNDAKRRERLKTRFPSVENVEGAADPYEGLYIRI